MTKRRLRARLCDCACDDGWYGATNAGAGYATLLSCGVVADVRTNLKLLQNHHLSSLSYLIQLSQPTMKLRLTDAVKAMWMTMRSGCCYCCVDGVTTQLGMRECLSVTSIERWDDDAAMQTLSC